MSSELFVKQGRDGLIHYVHHKSVSITACSNGMGGRGPSYLVSTYDNALVGAYVTCLFCVISKEDDARLY